MVLCPFVAWSLLVLLLLLFLLLFLLLLFVSSPVTPTATPAPVSPSATRGCRWAVRLLALLTPTLHAAPGGCRLVHFDSLRKIGTRV